MQIYLFIKSIQELSDCPDRLKHEAYRYGILKSFRKWQTIVPLIIISFISTALGFMGIFLNWPYYIVIIMCGICGGIGGIISTNIAIYNARNYFRDFVNKIK